jgi:hypothetical protein
MVDLFLCLHTVRVRQQFAQLFLTTLQDAAIFEADRPGVLALLAITLVYSDYLALHSVAILLA